LPTKVERVIALTLELPDMGALVADTPPELGARRRLVRRFDVEIDASDDQVTGRIDFGSSDDPVPR
jgi:hypothetical protein